MARRLDHENWWGDDGDTLVVFGHVDRHELAAAAEKYGRDEWGLWPTDFALDALPQHAYAVVASTDPDEPYLYYQRQPYHPSGRPVLPITIASAGYGYHVPDVADVVNLVESWAPPIAIERRRPTLDDRLISKQVYG